MIEKIYRARRSRSLSIPVYIDGKESRRINFSIGTSVPGEKKAKYVTRDEKVQKALENNSYYGVLYFLEKEEEIKTVEKKKKNYANIQKEETPVRAYPEVTTKAQAKTILMGEPYRCSALSINTEEKFQAKTKELNLEFPNIR